jgi:Ca2+-binding EF-hand superfamily protein
MAATSDVRAEKYSDTFNNFDVNGSGAVNEDDLAALVQRVTAQFGYGPGTSQYEAFEQACAQVWQNLLSATGKSGGAGGELSREEYVTMLLSASPGKIRSIFDPYVDGMFTLIDGNGDGSITQDEFEKHQLAWGLSDGSVGGTFAQLDTNNSGELSRAEYTEFMHQFFESRDPGATANALSGS